MAEQPQKIDVTVSLKDELSAKAAAVSNSVKKLKESLDSSGESKLSNTLDGIKARLGNRGLLKDLVELSLGAGGLAGLSFALSKAGEGISGIAGLMNKARDATTNWSTEVQRLGFNLPLVGGLAKGFTDLGYALQGIDTAKIEEMAKQDEVLAESLSKLRRESDASGRTGFDAQIYQAKQQALAQLSLQRSLLTQAQDYEAKIKAINDAATKTFTPQTEGGDASPITLQAFTETQLAEIENYTKRAAALRRDADTAGIFAARLNSEKLKQIDRERTQALIEISDRTNVTILEADKRGYEARFAEERSAGAKRVADAQKNGDDFVRAAEAENRARIRALQAGAVEDYLRQITESQEKYNRTLAETANLLKVGNIGQERAIQRNTEAIKQRDAALDRINNQARGSQQEYGISSEDVKRIEEATQNARKAKDDLYTFGEDFKQRALGPTADAFKGFITGASSAKEAVASLAAGVADAIAQMVANALAVKAITAAFGALSGIPGLGDLFGQSVPTLANSAKPGFATGGLVPGTGSGDTVPAMLTPGEFVLPKHVVQRVGADYLQRTIGAPSVSHSSISPQHLATGGSVQQPRPSRTPKPVPAVIANSGENLLNLLNPNSSEFSQHLAKNASKYRAALGIK